MSRPSRRRRDPALLRARYRTLFFLLLTALALALGYRAAAAPAAAGALLGLVSIRVARKHPAELAHTFVVLDWALLGIALVLSGGAESWLLVTVPFLALGQLAGTSLEEWPFLVGAVAAAARRPRDRRPVAGREPHRRRRQARRARRRRLRRGDAAPAAHRPARTPGARAQGRRQHRALHGHVPPRLPRERRRDRARGAPAAERGVRAAGALRGQPQLPRRRGQRGARPRRRAARRTQPVRRRARLPRAAGRSRAGPARPLARRGAADGERPRARGRRQPHRRAPADAGHRRRLVPHAARASRSCSAPPATRRSRRSSPPRWPAPSSRWRPRSKTRAATARVLPLPMRLASLRLWRSTSPASRCRRAWPSRSRYGSRGVRPAGCS